MDLLIDASQPRLRLKGAWIDRHDRMCLNLAS